MSIDTRIAIVRFPGQFWRSTHTWVSVPLGFVKTPTLTRLNPYPCARVRVALGYPRVTMTITIPPAPAPPQAPKHPR